MCLAIYKPKGIQIAKKYLENGFTTNDDGSGFAFPYRGKFQVFRGFKTFAHFWKAIKPLQSKHAMLIHFRLATHGDKSESNMHPFLICDSRIAIIHNGVLNIKTSDNKSDTRIFAERVLEPMFQRNPFADSAMQYLVETSIGDGNKIVALRSDGEKVIFNESSGYWHKGAWYSNKGYEEKKWTSSVVTQASNSVKSYWNKLAHPKSEEIKQGQTWVQDIDADEMEAEKALNDYQGGYWHNGKFVKHGSLYTPEGSVIDNQNELDYSGTSHHQKLTES